MEPYILISYLNDFVFCPRSIYFHQLYGRVSSRMYHTTDQTRGKAAHASIDSQKYTTASNVLQAIDVYSEHYQLGGKIDTFDTKKSLLVERKKKIKAIYDGYIFQLYGQYYCLQEMGYQVKYIKLYSMDDNTSYPIPLPDQAPEKKRAFEDLLQQMRAYRIEDTFIPNPNKCKHCVYNNLCDSALC